MLGNVYHNRVKAQVLEGKGELEDSLIWEVEEEISKKKANKWRENILNG